MNLIVNAHDASASAHAGAHRPSRCACATRRYAHKHSLDLGAWDMPTRASAMELNIPGIHGVGDSLIYFVDRYQRLLDLRRRLRAARRHQRASRRRSPACTGSASCRRSSATAPRDWLDFYQHALRLLGAAARPVLRRAAEGHAAREPVPQVLPAADRAAAGRGGLALGRAAAARRPRRARRAGGGAARCRSAASCSSTAARCSRARKAR